MDGWMRGEPTRWHCCVVDFISLSSLHPLSLLPFLGLCFYLMLSLSPPSNSLSPSFYPTPLLSLPPTPLSMHSMYDGASYTAGN